LDGRGNPDDHANTSMVYGWANTNLPIPPVSHALFLRERRGVLLAGVAGVFLAGALFLRGARALGAAAVLVSGLGMTSAMRS
jgi:hypothetical protein